MTISVLIAAYKADLYIPKALESLRLQKHTDWELIVVEDGSADDTKQLITNFAKTQKQPVLYFNHGTNKGVAETRNTLMASARGEAMAFLDADDFWEPGHLEEAAKALTAGYDIAVADVRSFELSSGQTLDMHSIGTELAENPARALIRSSLIITSSAVTLRTSLVTNVGRFLSDLKVGEDRDFWIRCAKSGAKFTATPRTCHYAKHSGSTMAKTLLVAEQDVLFREKYLNDSALPPSESKARLAEALKNLGRLVRTQDRQRSLKAFKRAWLLRPFDLKSAAYFFRTFVHA